MADTAELSTDVGLRLAILLLIQVVGMGIEPREHALQCPFQNFLSRLNHLCDFKESHLIRGETANVDA